MSEEAQQLFDDLYSGVQGQNPTAEALSTAALTFYITALMPMSADEREQELAELEAVVRYAVETRLQREKAERRPHLRLVYSDIRTQQDAATENDQPQKPE